MRTHYTLGNESFLLLLVNHRLSARVPLSAGGGRRKAESGTDYSVPIIYQRLAKPVSDSVTCLSLGEISLPVAAPECQV